MIERYEVLLDFGFKDDPFRRVAMETADVKRVGKLLNMAIKANGLVNIIAKAGTGKTTALEVNLKGIQAHVIRVCSANKEMVTISDIESCLIRGLSDVPLARARIARAIQLQWILGNVTKPVALILEEGHRMAPRTLRSLKTLRELSWNGKSPLFSVFIVGQYDPLTLPAVREVKLRSSCVTLRGLTKAEATQYIDATVGEVFEKEAIEAVLRLDGAHNFLELEEALLNVMSRALARGKKKVGAMEIYDVYEGGLKEMVKIFLPNKTNRDLGKDLNASATAISAVLNGKPERLTTEQYEKTKKGIGDLLDKEMSKVEQSGVLKKVG